jgi:acetylglutamate kinase
MTTLETGAPEPQEDFLAKAHTLAHALPFMRRYAGACFVVKYGGSTIGDPAKLAQFAADIVLLKQVGINPIVVHGGGPQIGAMLERLGLKSRFVDGLRVTDAATMEVAEMVLSGLINKQLVTAINRAGGNAIGLSGKDANLIRARKVSAKEDLGFVGEPAAVRADISSFLASSQMIPVIAPIGAGPNGESYNINADTVAGAVAGAAKAKRLLLLTDVPGVLGKDGALIAQLSAAETRARIADGTISGGMIPKVETCLDAVTNGVEAAVIIDGRVEHAILLEIFTDGGAGTLIGKV